MIKQEKKFGACLNYFFLKRASGCLTIILVCCGGKQTSCIASKYMKKCSVTLQSPKNSQCSRSNTQVLIEELSQRMAAAKKGAVSCPLPCVLVRFCYHHSDVCL